MVQMFGGNPEDFLPEIEIYESIETEFHLFADLDTQWNVSFSGPIGMKYEVVKVMVDAYGLPFDRFLISDMRTMEAAALNRMRITAERGTK